MPTALDSGIIAKAGQRNDFLSQLQSAASHQLGLPITTLSSNYVKFFESELEKYGLANIEKQIDIEEFSELISKDYNKYVDFVSSLEQHTIINSISFPHPLYRFIKDYYFVRISEAFCIYWYLNSSDDEKEGSIDFFPFNLNKRYKISIRKNDDYLWVFGPELCDNDLDEGTKREYKNEVDQELNKFKNILNKADSRVFDGHLHGDDQIIRAVFSRQKIQKSYFEKKIDNAVKILSLYECFSNLADPYKLPPNFFSKLLAAAMVSIEFGENCAFDSKFFNDDGSKSTQRYEVVSLKKGASVTLRTVENLREKYWTISNYQRNIEIAYANWTIFMSESISILREWLQKNSGALGPNAMDEKEEEIFKVRLARFLTFLFNSGECSIYQLRYRKSVPHLEPYAGYSRYPRSSERLAAMADHISNLITRKVGQKSIVIRAFKENEVQYCHLHNQKIGIVSPPNQTISFPENFEHEDWGRSLCAVPIRVSGIFWGVIEFVAMRPHSYPDVVRSKISEVISTMGPFLFERQLFRNITRINEIIVSDKTVQEKKKSLQPLVLDFFGAKSVAILKIDGTRNQEIKTFLQMNRPDIENATSDTEQNGVDYLKPYLNFVEKDSPIWFSKIGDSEFQKMFSGVSEKKFFDEARKDFICLAKIEWSGADDNRHDGVVILTYTHNMDSQENWPAIIDFSCRYLATVTSSLYGSEQWETTVRQKLAHEFSKSVGAIRATTKRLGSTVNNLPKNAQGVDKGLFENLVKDLKRHERNLENNTNILKMNRITSDFETDPRLYYVNKVLKGWTKSGDEKSTLFRALYNSIFIGASSEFNEKKISISRLDKGKYPRLLVDEWCLSEVMLTLKSNIIKYGLNNSEVFIRENSAINYGIRISNLGLKLDEHELRKIFQDEFRGHRAKERHPQDGNGFGLWYAERIMKEMGCDIRHSQSEMSEVGGARSDYAWHHFTISFPLTKVK